MKKFCLLLLSALCLSACINDDDFGTPGGGSGNATITLKVPGIVTPNTRAGLGAIEENSVREVDVLIFEQDENKEERYKYHIEGLNITDVQGDPTKKKINIHPERTTRPVRLVTIVNSRSLIESAGIAVGDTKSEVLNKIKIRWQSKWPVGPETAPNPVERFRPFPMWGETERVILISTVVTFDEEITLLRAVAKVDVGIDIEGDPNIGFGNRFLLDGVYACNVPDIAYVAPSMDDPGIENHKVTQPHVPGGVEYNQLYYDFDWQPSAENKVQKLFGEIYLPENSHTSVNRTFLVIAGYLDGLPDLCYYRIDFAAGNTTDLMHVLRNHRYLVNITGAQSRGFRTLQEAVQSERGSNIEYDLQLVEDEILDIKYNGQHMLGVNKSTLLADWQGSDKQIRVYTTYKGGWKATVSESWITLLPDPPANPNGNENPNYNLITNLNFRLTENTTGVRKGVITLKSGDLTMNLTIIQESGSNCLIAVPNSRVPVPWAAANGDGTVRIADPSAITLKLIWQDGLDVVTSFSGQTIQIGSVEGNALVAAVDASDKILWSWHIWVTRYNPEAVAGTGKNNHFTLMDRNLGALTAQEGQANTIGMMYQWGRKDPFPGPQLFSENVNDTRRTRKLYDINHAEIPEDQAITYLSAANLEASIQNPSTFYTGIINWLYDGTNGPYWNRADGSKGPFDPCPFGWRVPTSGLGNKSPWAGFEEILNPGTTGLVLPGVGNYPFAGYRVGRTGNFTSIRYTGYITTATPYGFGHFLLIYENYGSVNPGFSGGICSDAYPVRCVKIEY